MVPGCHKVVALIARAHIASAQGEPEQAARDAHDALAIAADTRAFLRLPDAAECLARLAAGDGNHQNAARLFGAAAAIRDDRGIARFPVYQAGYDAAVESSRDAFGERATLTPRGQKGRPCRSRRPSPTPSEVAGNVNGPAAAGNRSRQPRPTLCGSSATG